MESSPRFLSLIRLIANPAEFHGQRVRVVGFAVVQFEVKALYLSDRDWRSSITKNALWLDVAPGPDREETNQKVVLVEGTFDAHGLGHLGLYSGTITEIDRFELWGEF